MNNSAEQRGQAPYLLGCRIDLPEHLEGCQPVPPISARGVWDNLPQAQKDTLVRDADEALQATFPVITARHLTRYSRDGNRAEFEALYFTRRRLLNALILGELAENEGRFVPAIVDAAFMICEESGWQLPAHNAHKRGGARAPLPDPARPVLDLFAAETGAQISLLATLMPDALEAVAPGSVERFQQEVTRRVITPYLHERIWWMGHVDGPTNNWTAWCTQNVVMAALCLPLTNQQRHAVFSQALVSLDAFLSDMGEDGACPEGVFYFRHAGLCLWGALELIGRAAPEAIALVWKSATLRNVAEFIVNMHVDKNTYINFGDCPSLNEPCTAREVLFGRAVGSGLLEDFASRSVQDAGWSSMPNEINLWYRLLNVLHAREILSSAADAPKPEDIWYPSVGLMVARDGLFTLAAKAGSNGESHNHNDVGSVTLYKGGRPVLIDVGVETYTAKTFSSRRYEIWTMQSAWHNLPSFGGFMQADGDGYAAHDVVVSMDDRCADLAMELSGAWPADARVQTFHRQVTLLKGEKVIIRDHYESEQQPELNLMFAEKPEVTEQGLELPGVASIVLDGAQAIEIDPVDIQDERLLQSLPSRIYRARIAVADRAIQITIT